MRIESKIAARQWILNAIQNHSCIPNRETEKEIRKFIGKLQRGLEHLKRSQQLFLAVNSQDPEIRSHALKTLREIEKAQPIRKKRRSRKKNSELVRLVKEQRGDADHRNIRFEHAIRSK